MWREKI